MRLIVTAVISFMLVGCGQSGQSDVAKRAVESYINAKLPNTKLEYSQFDKIDGLEGEVFGVKHYEFDYAYEIDLPDGFYSQCVSQPNDPSCLALAGQFLRPLDVMSRIRVKGSVDLIKKESGWIAQGVTISSMRTCGPVGICDKD